MKANNWIVSGVELYIKTVIITTIVVVTILAVCIVLANPVISILIAGGIYWYKGRDRKPSSVIDDDRSQTSFNFNG